MVKMPCLRALKYLVEQLESEHPNIVYISPEINWYFIGIIEGDKRGNQLYKSIILFSRFLMKN